MTRIGPRPAVSAPRRGPFLLGVSLVTAAVLTFQVVQTRILSVLAWYYLAFFAISVAMLGMTAGAVWVYLKRASINVETLSALLSDTALMTAVAMPASVMVQFCLITSFSPTVTSVVSWGLLMAAMTVPYVFAGITVSVALTRSPFPVSQVYGVDLLGAALGCGAVIGLLDILDGPSAIVFAGAVAALSAWSFARAAPSQEAARLRDRAAWRRPLPVFALLATLVPLNMAIPVGFTPVLVKDTLEHDWLTRYEKWNSYSRIIAYQPATDSPDLWGGSPVAGPIRSVPMARLNIDGMAGTVMYHYDGTLTSIDFLRDDLVNLAYHLPGVAKSAVIGVGGGRDLLSAHLFGVTDITGVELNPIFIDLHTKDRFYKNFSGLTTIPNLKLHVDDARSWFAATTEQFDLIQMSMIDTWAATGAGAFSLSENGLYTLEGWRAFMGRLTDRGVFTVSRWYNAGDVNESSRMIALALATMMDAGVADPRRHVFVAHASRIATLVLSKSPFTDEQLRLLRHDTSRLGFSVLVDPERAPATPVLRAMVQAGNLGDLHRAASTQFLDLTVSTDNRPFFFNQLLFWRVPEAIARSNTLGGGVVRGNLTASITLVLILLIALVAVTSAIILPLRRAATTAPRRLIAGGTVYFSLIGLGFMFAEISLLQYFSVFLGHPVYALGVCLFSLILSSGLGSLASGRFPLATMSRVVVWATLVGVLLLVSQWRLTHLFALTTARGLPVRIAISLAIVMPLGFLMGFAFPTGMSLVERIDAEPAPWFWGINGATGVLASVLAVIVSMAFGINVTMALAGLCYLALIPAARSLMALGNA